MSKDKLRELLCQLWHRDISADDAFDELEELINHIKRLEEAGDAMVETTTTPAAEAWHKAKEAKP